MTSRRLSSDWSCSVGGSARLAPRLDPRPTLSQLERRRRWSPTPGASRPIDLQRGPAAREAAPGPDATPAALMDCLSPVPRRAGNRPQTRAHRRASGFYGRNSGAQLFAGAVSFLVVSWVSNEWPAAKWRSLRHAGSHGWHVRSSKTMICRGLFELEFDLTRQLALSK